MLAVALLTLNRGEYALTSGKQIANINDKILQRVTETLDALKIIKVFNYEKPLYAKSVKDSQLLQTKSFSVYKTSSLLFH